MLTWLCVTVFCAAEHFGPHLWLMSSISSVWSSRPIFAFYSFLNWLCYLKWKFCRLFHRCSLIITRPRLDGALFNIIVDKPTSEYGSMLFMKLYLYKKSEDIMRCLFIEVSHGNTRYSNKLSTNHSPTKLLQSFLACWILISDKFRFRLLLRSH